MNSRTTFRWCLLETPVCIVLTVLMTSLLSSAAENAWPQFHGPNRDNKSPDTNLLKSWPEGGPGRIWETSGIGEGYSTVAITGNRIYTTGAVNGDCVITCLDMEGRKLWTKKNGKTQ